MARPLMLAAMVLVAACFSLRFFRMGGVEFMVSGGVAAGFVLYVATKVINDLGEAGFISAPVAGLVAGLVGCLVWRIRFAAARGWLMGSAVSSSLERSSRVQPAEAVLTALDLGGARRAVRCGSAWLRRPHAAKAPAARSPPPSAGKAARQARHRRRRTRLRQGQEHRLRGRLRPALLPGSHPSGRPRRLQSRDQARLRRRSRQDDRRARRHRLWHPVRAQRQFPRRLHRQRPGADLRQDALHLAAGRAVERRGDRARTRAPTRPASRARIIPSGRRSGRCARPRSSRTRRPTPSTTKTRRCSSGACRSSTCPIFRRRTRPSTSRPDCWRRSSSRAPISATASACPISSISRRATI